MKRCAKCGARNADEARSCTLCGTFFKAGGAGQDALENYEPRMMRGGKQTHRGDNMKAAEAAASAAAAPNHPATPAAPAPPPTPAREDMRGERHYLILTFGEPFKLDPKLPSIVLGRDADAAVRLPSLKASRRHAEIRWKDGRVIIRDLGSRNGTWVEGSRVDKQHVLEDGETVRVGDSLLTYRFLVPGEELRLEQGPADTLIDEPILAAPAALTPHGLEGELVFLGMSELLKRLITLRASGRITVKTGGSEGTIVVRSGVAAEVSYAALEGPVALQALASLTRGTFRFVPDEGWRAPTATGVQQVHPDALK